MRYSMVPTAWLPRKPPTGFGQHRPCYRRYCSIKGNSFQTFIMDDLYVIKIGGAIIDDEPQLAAFLQQFAGISGKKILVHGGGKLATSLATTLGIKQEMV